LLSALAECAPLFVELLAHPLLLSALAECAQLFDQLLAAPEIVKCVLNFS